MTMSALVLGLLVGAGCRRHALPTQTILVGPHRMLVEVADDGQEQARGLMNRDSLGANEGMLFVYPESKERSFWMKNTRIPLSIAFAAPDGTIVSMFDMRPMSSRSTRSGADAMYALEVNQGWFEDHDVSVGDKLGELPPPPEH